MSQHQRGFALLTSMLVLLVLSIVVVNAVRTNLLNERASGGYMDRTRAFQAAEQAIQQGKALLMANTTLCFESALGCSVSGGQVSAIASGTTPLLNDATYSSNLPTGASWADGRAVTISPSTKSDGTAQNTKYMVTRLANTSLVTPTETGGTQSYLQSNCKAYSIIGRGVGMDSNAVVMLQVVTWLCPI